MESAIIIIAIIHSYVFAVLFFRQKKATSYVLAVYMISFFLQAFLLANLYIFEINQLYILFYLLLAPLTLIDFPLIYIYVKMMVEKDFKWNFKVLKHFIPAGFFFIMKVGFFLGLSYENKLLLFETREEVAMIPGLRGIFSIYAISIITLFVQMFFYSILMIRKLLIHRKNIEKFYSFKHKITLNWLFVFVIIYLAYYIFEILVFLLSIDGVSERLYFSIVSLHIFFIGIWGLRQKAIYQKNVPQPKVPIDTEKSNINQELPESLIDEIKSINEIGIIDEDQIDKKAPISKQLIKELAQKIVEAMERDKMYLDSELSLEDLAKKLNFHKNYVSYVINTHFKISFYKLINSYRIDFAKKILANPDKRSMSIEGIAKTVGYKSRNVFYPIFKRHVGITPLQYRSKELNRKNKT